MADRAIRWLVPLAALAVWLHLVLVLLPQLATLSAQGTPFDLRPFGYSIAEARAYVAQLSPAGLALYLGPVRLDDSIFPILLMVALMLPLRGRGQAWFLPALAYGLADLGENIAVARILRAGSEMAASDVLTASTLTEVKFAGFGLALVLALWSLWQKWRQR